MPNQSSFSPSIVLHAGGPKTGSGSIQRAFHPKKPQISQSLLEKLGFRFFYSRPNPSPNLGRCLNELSNSRFSKDKVNDWRMWLKNQETETYSCLVSQFVFSAEQAGSPMLRREQAVHYSRFLRSLGTVTDILYYARPIMSLALSLGLQSAKASAIKPLANQLQAVTDIAHDHIITKYKVFSSLYEQAHIQFLCFDRQRLLSHDVRIDFASRLGTSQANLMELEQEISAVPSANEKLDLPVLLIMRQIYDKAGLNRNSRPPSLFRNFMTLGQWAGVACTHADLFTTEEIEHLYQSSLLEISSLRQFSTDDSFASIVDFFSKSLKSKDYYLSSSLAPIDLDSYRFTISAEQLRIVRDILGSLRRLGLSGSSEFRVLKSVLSEPAETEYCAQEVLAAVLTATMQL